MAEAYLLKQGYQILAKNWRCAAGELDLVTQQGEMIVFIEVRTRRGEQLGSPEESITPRKRAKLIEVAQTFLAETEAADCSWRIDVIAMVLDRQTRVVYFNHLEWAVEE